MNSPADTEYELINTVFNEAQMVQSPTIHDVTPDPDTPAEPRYANVGVMVQTANQENLYERPHVSRIQDTDKDYEILHSDGRSRVIH